jgi:Ca2+/Na+ antiporter
MNTELILGLIKTVTVAIGLAFLLITLRAYRRDPNPGLFFLLIAVGLMTLAAVAEGLAFQAAGLSLDQAHIIEAVFTFAAFAVFLVSVVGYRVKPRKVRRPVDEARPK